MDPLDAVDLEIIAQVIHAEARGEPWEGQVAVAAVVLNRIRDERFPGSVREVVQAPGQFVISRGAPMDKQFEAALRGDLIGYQPPDAGIEGRRHLPF